MCPAVVLAMTKVRSSQITNLTKQTNIFATVFLVVVAMYFGLVFLLNSAPMILLFLSGCCAFVVVVDL